jgi:hypothetical protein
MAMENGTMWHRRLFSTLVDQGIPFMQEVKLNRWMNVGWSGTADLIFWDADKGGFVLGDLKTMRGEGLRWIARDGAKTEHMWQCSAYWYAFYDAGFPLVNGFSVFYLPTSSGGSDVTAPIEAECTPLSRESVYGQMDARWMATARYLESLVWGHPDTGQAFLSGSYTAEACFVTPELAPIMPREQKLSWNDKTKVFDLKLYPHWSAQYCPYDDTLCACSSQGINKIGHYNLDQEYVPYKDSEELALITPSEKDYRSKEVTIVSI